MGLTPKKGLLFLSGAVIAGLGAAYIFGAFDGRQSSPVPIATPQGDESKPASPKVAGGKEGRETATSQQASATDEPVEEPAGKRPEEAGETEQSDTPVETAIAETIDPPSFDIVRVEPDGSMVIAGRAAPNAQVEIVNGATVIGTATSGPSGDFAAVLDNPLKPGDYQIVLRATTPDNLVATSLETAIVTVPDSETGQVLALVDQPGEPSRLITVPEAKSPSSPSTEEDTPTAAPATEETIEAASEAAEEETAQEVAEALSEQATQDTSPAEVEPQDEEQAAAPPVPTQDEAERAKASEPAEAMDTTTASGEELFIEAVEIDGGEIFIAGAASPGRVVRVYANKILLGEATATPNGRFLVETKRELPVGDYIVRADMLSEDGRSVIARAAVPFTRTSGDKLSAVATTPEMKNESSTAQQRAPVSSPDTEPAAGSGVETGAPKVATAPAQPESQPGEVPADDALAEDSMADATAAGDAVADGDATAPKLSPVEGSVIIRRGDTLWQISRRVYGRGIRYTTLYLANQDQIEDPDRIWPGQVFTVPDSTDEGEPADMEAIQDQVVPPETSE